MIPKSPKATATAQAGLQGQERRYELQSEGWRHRQRLPDVKEL